MYHFQHNIKALVYSRLIFPWGKFDKLLAIDCRALYLFYVKTGWEPGIQSQFKLLILQ